MVGSLILIIIGFVVLLLGFLLVIAIFLAASQHNESDGKVSTSLEVRQFGPGSINAFTWYFEGQSQVNVSSIMDICNWLRACQYTHDQKLFMKHDFWQHPLTFEQIRMGDCEDHALWAWRKLVELGLKTEFVVGDTKQERHAWVVFTWKDGKEYLFETTTKQGQMIHPLMTTNTHYYPELSIDHNLKTYRYKKASLLFN